MTIRALLRAVEKPSAVGPARIGEVRAALGALPGTKALEEHRRVKVCACGFGQAVEENEASRVSAMLTRHVLLMMRGSRSTLGT